MRIGRLLALLLGGCSGGSAITPGGIVSANPCVDAVLAQITTPGQIAAVSAFSHDAASASAPLGWARQYPAVGITAEEIVAARPRLLLTGNLASSSTSAALTKAEIRSLRLGVPATVNDSLAQVRAIASATGRVAEGETLIRRIEHSLQSGGMRARGSAIIWQAGGFVAGKGTLQDELLTRAGFANASDTYGLDQWQQLPLETLIRKPPTIIFMASSGDGEEGRSLALRQRLVKRLGGTTKIVPFPDRLLFCGGPTIIEAMQVLSMGALR